MAYKAIAHFSKGSFKLSTVAKGVTQKPCLPLTGTGKSFIPQSLMLILVFFLPTILL